LKLICTVAAFIAVCVLAPVAQADYTVYACKGPTGAPSPSTGWEPVTGGNATASNECSAGGVLSVGMTGVGPWTGGQGAEHRFAAPTNTRISRVRLQRRTTGLAGNLERWAYTLFAGSGELESCEAGGASKCTADLDGPVDFPGLDTDLIGFRAGCAQIQTSACAAPSVRVEVPRVAISLKDGTAPQVTNIGGSLAAATGAVKGTLTSTYDSTDTGGGLYRTIVELDGTPISAETAGYPGCGDADASNSDPYEFTAPVPCPLTLTGTSTAVDTTKLADGPHTITVLAEDAAGNRSTVIGAKPLTVANKPASSSSSGRPNGVNADVKGRLRVWFDRNSKHTLTSRYGKRVVIRGRLVNAKGRSIQGARIDVYHRRGAKGKLVQLTKTGLKTRKNGRLTLILPLDLTTRNIVLAYRSTRPGPITTRQTLKLRVIDANGKTVTKRKGKLGRVG
jgi:hypothetical protein